MPRDLEFWRQWEGVRAGGEYPLGRCLGAGARGAVFETEFQGDPAAIKVVPGTPEAIAAARRLWTQAEDLSHPALIRIFASGETARGEVRCAYCVMERAEENLAEVLAGRDLTAAEGREMLPPLLDALRYLHRQGFAHGALTPANILASGDQLKVSSDNLIAGGDPAGDCRAIGALLEEIFGARRSREALPEPFAEIARNCLTPNASSRWDLAKIEARLRGGRTASRWSFPAMPLAGAAAAAIAAWLFLWPAPAEIPVASPLPPPAEDKPSPAPAIVAAPPKPVRPQPAPTVKPPRAPVAAAAGTARVMPQIPQAALNTIVGRVRLNIRVEVDAEGNVTAATAQPPPVSQYFTARVLAAARAWKFPAGESARQRTLRFELTPAGVQVYQ